MNIDISVQVSKGVARALQQLEPPTTDIEELVNLQEELGFELKPIFPNTEDPDLVIWFTAKTSNAAAAEQVIARLRSLKMIEAAFIKPPSEPP